MKVKVMHFVLTLIFLIAWENGISQEKPSERVPSTTKNSGESVYPLIINDARAVYLNKENFDVAADVFRLKMFFMMKLPVMLSLKGSLQNCLLNKLMTDSDLTGKHAMIRKGE